MRNIVYSLIIFFFFSSFAYQIFAQEHELQKINLYQPKDAPAFYFENVNPKSELSFIDSGKYFGQNHSTDYLLTVMLFFRVDCKPCLEMIEPLKQLNQKYKNQKVFVLLVSIDEPDKQTEIMQMIEKSKIWIPVGYDTYTKNYVSKRYLGNDLLLPNLFLIDNKGKILFEFDSTTGLFDRLSALIEGHIQLEDHQ